MADDRPEGNAEATPEDLTPDSGRTRRAPPTIDLEATEVSSETRHPRRRGGARPCGATGRIGTIDQAGARGGEPGGNLALGDRAGFPARWRQRW